MKTLSIRKNMIHLQFVLVLDIIILMINDCKINCNFLFIPVRELRSIVLIKLLKQYFCIAAIDEEIKNHVELKINYKSLKKKQNEIKET